MNLHRHQFVALAITLTLFGAIDLLVTLVTPGRASTGGCCCRRSIAAVGTLVGFPLVLAFLERQQRPYRASCVRELEALHGMDTAIVSEMELERVLDVAVKRVMGAVDAVGGGVVLHDAATGAESTFFARTPDHRGQDAEAFARLLRGGESQAEYPPGQGVWNALVYPLRVPPTEASPAGQVAPIAGYVAAGRALPGRPFADAERALMQALASTIAVAVHNAYALRAAREAARVIQEGEQVRADLARERRVARALTEGLLPEILPQIGNFHLSKRYEAQSHEAEVGGDIYDLFPLGQGLWGVVIADVSGKGLAAAQKTAMVKYSLRSYAREHTSPAAVLTLLNDTLSDEDQMTGFVTLFYGVLDCVRYLLTYCSAGHEPPIVRRANGDFETLEPTGMVLGAMRDMPFDDACLHLYAGDGLLLYTDGLTEARSFLDDSFLTIDGVQAMLGELASAPPATVADALWERVESFTGRRQLDDTALLWISHQA